MSGPIRAGVYGPREDVDKTSVDYPAVKVRYASYEQIEKREDPKNCYFWSNEAKKQREDLIYQK